MKQAVTGWRVRVDTGGTFTDAWAAGPDGEERRGKVLSSGLIRVRVISAADDGWVELAVATGGRRWLTGFAVAGGGTVVAMAENGRRLRLSGGRVRAGDLLEMGNGEEAPVVAVRMLLDLAAEDAVPMIDLRVATTRGTNALLEGKGSPVALFLTAGLGDLPWLRDQRRDDLFRLDGGVTQPLATAVVEVEARMAADGTEIKAPDETAVRAAARGVVEKGIEVAAVALLHAWRNPGHERMVAGWLRDEGFRETVLSSEVAPVIRLLPRCDTTVVDACLSPVMRHFVGRVCGSLPGVSPWMMTSAGGLVEADRFRPKDSLLSGPAGGLVGAAAVARAAGFSRVLSFDMGGTSTDVARISGDFVYQYEQRIGPARVVAPGLRIETVAAGGGSVCRWRDGRLEVGPDSAGADPGPACYGRGGPFTVTDVNLLLGKMREEGAGIPFDRRAAEERFGELLAAMEADGQAVDDRQGLLEGLRAIAVERMAEAIRMVSVRDGYAPADHALLAFGGAGPQHACAVAARLGVRAVLVPGDAGLLSAWGLEVARRERQGVVQTLRALDDAAGEWWIGPWQALADETAARLGVRKPSFRWLAELRLAGQDSAVEIEVPGPAESAAAIAGAFEARYRALYGYRAQAGAVIEVVALRVVVREAAAAVMPEVFGEVELAGPAVLQDRFSTCVVEQGWTLRRGNRGTLWLQREVKEPVAASGEPAAGVVADGLFRHRFEGLVGECGALLQRVARSVNVKERLDFSCALLDAGGRLAVNAPHVPVHLGALGVCVREVARVCPPGPGDVVVVNHPGFGGSHLPDVTVVAGAFDHAGKLLGWLANRAHHAEIGGKAPGSMPADATCLAEEGAVIPPMCLVRGGQACFEEVTRCLTGGPWPTRRLVDNLADLEAQVAAVNHGVCLLQDLAHGHGAHEVRRRLAGVGDRSARLMRERLAGRGEWSTGAADALDDGTPLAVRIVVCDARMRIDFSGSGGVHPRNLNATPAIVRSVVLYALRLWLGEDVPLNEGLLEPVEIILPHGLLNPGFQDDPARCPAVVGGNVEVSQRLADLLLGALGVCADGPGTMNNFLFGDGGFGYYETIAGGGAAGPGFDGRGGRHCHMTNTALTDPEVLEARYPVRLRRFELRRGSGGVGRWHGGDGVVREIEFLRDLTVSFLCERRCHGPRGRQGGGDGTAGAQWRILADGSREKLPGAVTYLAKAGERVRIETPGGGAWGNP